MDGLSSKLTFLNLSKFMAKLGSYALGTKNCLNDWLFRLGMSGLTFFSCWRLGPGLTFSWIGGLGGRMGWLGSSWLAISPNIFSKFFLTSCGLDSNETTALYTPEKIRDMFLDLSDDYNNENLKKIFTDRLESKIWQFIRKSDILTYYYSDYRTVKELLLFLENLKKAYNMTLPITLSNRYS